MRSTWPCVLAALVLSSSAAAPPAWDPKSTHALLVGILEWKNKQFASFPKAGRKDRELERALIAAGVPRANVVFLADREATHDGIKREWAEMAARAGEGSTLLFYFTGHGGASGGEVYLCDYDAHADCVGQARVDDEFFYFIQYDDLTAAWSEWVTAERMRRRGGAR